MNILITGASKGIGYELALNFAAIESSNLFLISRSKERLERLKTECYKINPVTKVTIIPFDIENIVNGYLPEEISCQHLDILINNAGLLINKDFADFEGNDMIKLAQVNFLAPAMLIKQCIGKMGGEKPTHVINIGSMGGYQGSIKFKGLSMYSASKAAIASLTECLALEYKDKNIFFNCLALGAVQTEMLHKAFPGFVAPISANEMAGFISQFALNGHKYFNGKVLPVSISTP
jgi:3-oxoacyl-[acyl-carrier protein] reductase